MVDPLFKMVLDGGTFGLLAYLVVTGARTLPKIARDVAIIKRAVNGGGDRSE